ncbi:MAG: biopolymer transporter ExbD [Leptolyngbyaceae cyanobacterium bins.59]|nr:biopolymer transporter ExbD [Leptolyngbyaceae cyanobacterium bins.59]
MRFKTRARTSSMPDVNLIPMLDVILTILTFFIVITMTLGGQQAVNITLPTNAGVGAGEVAVPESMIVGLDLQSQMTIAGQPIQEAELIQRIRAYLAQNPQGAVILRADRKIAYEEVARVLGIMRSAGGERVSLAIDIR